MDIDFNYSSELAFQLVLSFVVGSILGLEREYRSKAAGLRTMIIICLGSTIFTEISLAIGGASSDRIASTVVTGIGFLGAGVISKDNFTINGITTATTIWISALGMAIGAGEYFIAVAGTGAALIVLIVLEHVKKIFARIHSARTYKIACANSAEVNKLLETHMNLLQLGHEKLKDLYDGKNRLLHYEVFGKENNLNRFNDFLRQQIMIVSYEY